MAAELIGGQEPKTIHTEIRRPEAGATSNELDVFKRFVSGAAGMTLEELHETGPAAIEKTLEERGYAIV